MSSTAVVSTPISPAAPSSNLPHPFLKWVGGKRALVPVMAPKLPAPEELQGIGYRETCLGGGAVFFELYHDVRPAILADDNPRLINAYVAVRDQLPKLLATLANYQEQFDACADWESFRQTYIRIRSREPSGACAVEVARAAWLMVMNKTCMNGLYRENSRGVFNVGPGKWGNEDEPFRMPRIFDRQRLEACSRSLQGVRLVCGDFEPIIQTARRGEGIYCDPPYLPLSATANFTSYTKRGFGLEAHRRLADAVADAAKRGVMVAVSNSDTAMSRALYCQFQISKLEARRSVNSKADKRGPVKEILVTTYRTHH
jgi:DNA adenine methylase